MGAISESIASSARSHGAEIVTNATVDKIVTKGWNYNHTMHIDDTFSIHPRYQYFTQLYLISYRENPSQRFLCFPR